MDILRLEETRNTPRVILNPENNFFEIVGKSHPENTRAFFNPILQWLDDYLIEIKNKENSEIEFHLNYSYLNSSSYKYLTVLLKKMEEYIDNEINVKFFWHYEEDDEDMRDSGQELFSFTKLKVSCNFLPFTPEN